MKFQHIFLMTTALLAASTSAQAVVEVTLNDAPVEPKFVSIAGQTFLEIPAVKGQVTGIAVEPLEPAGALAEGATEEMRVKHAIANRKAAFGLRVKIDTRLPALFDIGTDKLSDEKAQEIFGRFCIPKMATLEQLWPLTDPEFSGSETARKLKLWPIVNPAPDDVGRKTSYRLVRAPACDVGKNSLNLARLPSLAGMAVWNVSEAQQIQMGPLSISDIIVQGSAQEVSVDDLLEEDLTAPAAKKTLKDVVMAGPYVGKPQPDTSLKAYYGAWVAPNHFALNVIGAAQMLLAVTEDLLRSPEEAAEILRREAAEAGINLDGTALRAAAAVEPAAADSDDDDDSQASAASGTSPRGAVASSQSTPVPVQPSHAELFIDGEVNPSAGSVPVTSGTAGDTTSAASTPRSLASQSSEASPAPSPRPDAPASPAPVQPAAPVVASEPVASVQPDVPAVPAVDTPAPVVPVQSDAPASPAPVQPEAPVVASESVAPVTQPDVPAVPAVDTPAPVVPVQSDAPASPAPVQPVAPVAASEPVALVTQPDVPASTSAPSTPAKSSVDAGSTSTPSSSERHRFVRLSADQLAALSTDEQAAYAEKLARHERHKAKRAAKAAAAAGASSSATVTEGQ